MTRYTFIVPNPGKRGEPAELTSIVMDEAEFETLLQRIAEGDPVVNIQTGNRMSTQDVEALRGAKTVPMIARGSKTEYLFKLYDVDTPLMSAIVRGTGQILLERLVKS